MTHPQNSVPSTPPTYQDVLTAEKTIRQHIPVTDLIAARHLKTLVAAEDCYYKLENRQFSGAFKDRGAANKILSLTPQEIQNGLIAQSAGNHAAGVASFAQKYKAQVHIVMPETTPFTKIERVKSYGAQIYLKGSNVEECSIFTQELQQKHNYTLIHPFDDPKVIAGQGTCGLEILRQLPGVRQILVPVGGGGLIGGICLAIKEHHPNIRIVGVQTKAIPSLSLSLRKGAPTSVPFQVTLADGIAVKTIGKITFPIVQKYMDEVINVSEDSIHRAILHLLEKEKLLVEGAGAVGLAAILEQPHLLQYSPTVMILSGGNIDMSVLGRIIDRGLVLNHRLCRVSLLVPNFPGILAQLTSIVAQHKANILQISHDHQFHVNNNIFVTRVTLILQTDGEIMSEGIRSAFHEQGFEIIPES